MLDGLTAEYIIHAHLVLYVLLSLLFNMIYVYGVVPDAFCWHSYASLVKKFDGDRTVSDNYRCIILSPVTSKLYEMTLMKLLVLSCNQIVYSMDLNGILVAVKPYLPQELLLSDMLILVLLSLCVY